MDGERAREVTDDQLMWWSCRGVRLKRGGEVRVVDWCGGALGGSGGMGRFWGGLGVKGWV